MAVEFREVVFGRRRELGGNVALSTEKQTAGLGEKANKHYSYVGIRNSINFIWFLRVKYLSYVNKRKNWIILFSSKQIL